MPTTFRGLQEPSEPRILEGAMGTLCAHCRPVWALGHRVAEGPCTLRNGQNSTFPAFPAFLAFLTDSGGPSLPSRPNWRGTSKVARMATLRLLDTFGTLEPWPACWPGWPQNPYSWPPEPDRTDRFWQGQDSRRPYCSLSRKCRFCTFREKLEVFLEKREAAGKIRPVYCSNVFQVDPFLDTF